MAKITQTLLAGSEQTMQDLTGPDELELIVDATGSRVWINTEHGCVFRACRIKHLTVAFNDKPSADREYYNSFTPLRDPER